MYDKYQVQRLRSPRQQKRFQSKKVKSNIQLRIIVAKVRK